jgi:integrase
MRANEIVSRRVGDLDVDAEPERDRKHEVGTRKAHLRDWVIDHVHRICDAAKVPPVTAHAMRGLLATLTAERGLAGHLIAATLGHENKRTTTHAYAAPGAATAGAAWCCSKARAATKRKRLTSLRAASSFRWSQGGSNP